MSKTKDTKISVAEIVSIEDQAKIAKAKAKTDKRWESIMRLRQYHETLDTNDPLKDDLKLIVGSGARGSRGSGSKTAGARIAKKAADKALRDMFIERDEVSEMDIFKAFKIGQPEMATKIRVFLKVPNTADRIWVKFFQDEEVYRLMGVGAKAPKDWDGFEPVDENIL